MPEPKPEALPARCGIALTISARMLTNNLDPKVADKYGQKKLKEDGSKSLRAIMKYMGQEQYYTTNTIKFLV